MTASDDATLRARLAFYEKAERLERRIDDDLELALLERRPLERAMPLLLQDLLTTTGAGGAAVISLDESLTERVFRAGELPEDRIEEARSKEGTLELEGGGALLVHRLDVAGEDFGRALLALPPGSTEGEREEAAELLHRFAELVDNHLAAIALSRRRFDVIRAISDALKDPVLERGLRDAIEILRREVDFDDLVLICRHEEEPSRAALRYQVYRDGALTHDSASPDDARVDALLRAEAGAFLAGQDEVVREHFGITRFREEVLITGLRTARVVGRVLVTSRQGEFHTHDRELLDRFADSLRQRVVDFNREWKQLSRIFSRPTCERLLREEGYRERWLTPREQEVAVLYTDITGFTRLSEQVMRTPEAIGRLIRVWSEAVVHTIWAHDGVFDKMVGDCVIALFGPPFDERTPAERCQAALDAAVEMRRLTRALAEREALPELRGHPPPEVATGINLCPMSVGLFGPNEDYTGFSSGMNNAARLQGLAAGGEILCMEPLVEAIGAPARFGERRAATVKNVAVPLAFRAVTE